VRSGGTASVHRIRAHLKLNSKQTKWSHLPPTNHLPPFPHRSITLDLSASYMSIWQP